MKKGDIVQLKPGQYLRQAEVHNWLPPGFGILDFSYFTVSGDPVWLRVGCGDEIAEVVRFDEIQGCKFLVNSFDILLATGEPDVNQLMEKSKFREATIGF